MSLAEHVREFMSSCGMAESAPIEYDVRPSLIAPPRSDPHATPTVTIAAFVSLQTSLIRKRPMRRRIRAPDPKFESYSTAKRE
ncbi:MAG TPA: hypothetical protein VN397_00885 [Candidatus Methylomirabilis sp.]|nr:hypothetical protein [Candidatus Methylomirabilis sp.]